MVDPYRIIITPYGVKVSLNLECLPKVPLLVILFPLLLLRLHLSFCCHFCVCSLALSVLSSFCRVGPLLVVPLSFPFPIFRSLSWIRHFVVPSTGDTGLLVIVRGPLGVPTLLLVLRRRLSVVPLPNLVLLPLTVLFPLPGFFFTLPPLPVQGLVLLLVLVLLQVPVLVLLLISLLLISLLPTFCPTVRI